MFLRPTSLGKVSDRSMMMIFVGTNYDGGHQFHVWIPQRAITDDLFRAIWVGAVSLDPLRRGNRPLAMLTLCTLLLQVHERIPHSQFILQHEAKLVDRSATLAAQSIGPFCTVHMYRLADLKWDEAPDSPAPLEGGAKESS